jgi:hypothetical protein
MRRKFVVAGLAVLAASVASQARAALLWQYKFDEANSGTTTALDTGTGTAANGTFSGTATRTSNTPNSFSLGAMSTGSAGAADYVTGGDAQKLDGLSSMTVTGWINLQSAPATSDRLVSKLFSNGTTFTGFDLRFAATNGQLAFSEVNNVAVASLTSVGSSANLSTASGWQFFAVSFDGTNVRFFTGGESTAASQLGTTQSGSAFTTPADTTAVVRVGGTPATTSDRTPNAFFDDIRIYDTALTTAAQLDAVRLENVPEPAAISLAAVGAAGLLLRRRPRDGRFA